MKKHFKLQVMAALLLLSLTGAKAQSASIDSFTTGSGSWQVPEGVSSITVEIWGAGGGGGGSSSNNNGGSGGGSGAYTKKTIDVIAGYQFNYSIGVGGTAGLLTAGTGGTGGSSTFVGLALASVTNMSAGGGTGGAGNAGAVGAGGATSGGGTGSVAGANGGQGNASGGAGGNAPNGGNGGAAIQNSPGNSGLAPGGGGGGGELQGSSRAGGAGGNGRIRITYVVIMDVKLSAFTGTILGSKNQLNWSTETETNNDFFVLEKSENGINWEDTELVNGAGTTVSTNYYQVIDYTPFYPTTYYRIKQVDFDESVEYSNIISLSGEKVNTDFISNTYPNPACDQLSFSFQGNEDGVLHVRIMNELGLLIEDRPIEVPTKGQVYNLDTSDLASGMYMLCFSQGSIVKNQKLQIQR